MRMWSATHSTVFMVTHDVDEAIMLSDRIALMTNSPSARLAECLAVDLPRPRSREALIDMPEYTRLRNHILHFLLRASRPSAPEASPSLPTNSRPILADASAVLVSSPVLSPSRGSLYAQDPPPSHP
jgi:nitrate/nitrite transport system ATP-binding protein